MVQVRPTLEVEELELAGQLLRLGRCVGPCQECSNSKYNTAGPQFCSSLLLLLEKSERLTQMMASRAAKFPRMFHPSLNRAVKMADTAYVDTLQPVAASQSKAEPMPAIPSLVVIAIVVIAIAIAIAIVAARALSLSAAGSVHPPAQPFA